MVYTNASVTVRLHLQTSSLCNPFCNRSKWHHSNKSIKLAFKPSNIKPIKGSYWEIKTLWTHMDIKIHSGSPTMLGLFHTQAAGYHKLLHRLVLWIDGKHICSEWFCIFLVNKSERSSFPFQGHRQEGPVCLRHPPPRVKLKFLAVIHLYYTLYIYYLRK